jgi:hypothetical protein
MSLTTTQVTIGMGDERPVNRLQHGGDEDRWPV